MVLAASVISVTNRTRMAGNRRQRKPTFLWQAVLILLPVIILAVVGWAALRQDKVLAQHEATVRAQAIADDLSERIWARLNETKLTGRLHFTTDSAGHLIFPPPYAAVPTPQPLDLVELDAN